MAKKNFIGLNTEEFEQFARQFDALAEDIDEGAEVVLKRTHDYVLPKVEEGVKKAYLPAQGKYSRGDLENAIINKPIIEKDGTILEMPFGFDTKKAPYSYYVINGTPKMRKSTRLWTTFHGRKFIKEVENFQQKVMWSFFAFKKDNRKGG